MNVFAVSLLSYQQRPGTGIIFMATPILFALVTGHTFPVFSGRRTGSHILSRPVPRDLPCDGRRAVRRTSRREIGGRPQRTKRDLDRRTDRTGVDLRVISVLLILREEVAQDAHRHALRPVQRPQVGRDGGEQA